jgi:hypothetical protein
MGFAIRVLSDAAPALYLEAGRTFQPALSNFLSASVEQGQLFRIEFERTRDRNGKAGKNITVGLTI